MLLAATGLIGCGFEIAASNASGGDDVASDASSDGTDDPDAPDAPGTVARRCTLQLGSDHSCVLRDTDRSVWCWGDHTYGELGAGTGLTYTVTALQVPLGGQAESLAVKSYHGCAALADRTVRCWGMNDGNQIGDGLSGHRYSPATVAGLGDALEVGVGRSYSCARRSSGTISCWGANSSGQLGDGGTVPKTTPTSNVMGLTSTPTALHVASGHACVVLPGGAGACWGSNTFRQLGDGTTTDRSTAVAMPLSSIAQIAPSGYSVQPYTGGSTCARKTDGTVWCWGSNDFGQLGNGATSTTPTSTPVRVMDIDDASHVTAGRYHVCALRTGGVVQCWGRNEAGQLGDNSTTLKSKPTTVVLPRPALHVGAGGFHSCALLDDYALYCWGYNGSGQLGDGSLTLRLSPVASQTLCQ